MGLGGWQKPLAQYATLGLAVFRGLKHLECGRMSSSHSSSKADPPQRRTPPPKMKAGPPQK